METYVYVSVGLILLVWVMYLFIWRDLKQAHQLNNFRKREFEDNLNIDAIEEPHLYRELSESEKAVLSKNTKSSKWFKILLILGLLIFGLIFWSIVTIFSQQLLGKPNVIFSAFIVLVVLTIIYGSINHDKTYLDLRSPVFKVKGKLYKKIKEQDTAGTVTKKAFVVRGLEFDSQNNPQVENLWNKCSNSEIIEIEYSPFSRYIWKIKKV